MGHNIVLPFIIKIIIHVINVIVMIVFVVIILVLIIITKEGELAASDLGFTTVKFEPLHFAAGGNGDLRAAAIIF